MDKFTTLTGVAAPLPITNIDTDMIIPKQYLKTIARTGLGKGLFSEMRFNEDGSENPDFVLNKPAYRNAQIVVAEDNFGCGSSREHAPWALEDAGFRAIVAPSFADIFRGNCANVGIVCAVLPEADVQELIDAAPATATVDLERRVVVLPSGREVSFPFPDEGLRHRILNGLDEIGLTLRREDEIRDYETTRERPGPSILELV
jgi:3-isopropylmalate/(R)-2-methylmalate dehydratase small subunit